METGMETGSLGEEVGGGTGSPGEGQRGEETGSLGEEVDGEGLEDWVRGSVYQSDRDSWQKF